MDYDKRAIGQRIKSIRQKLGLTLEEFGSLIDNSSKSNVSKWENGVSIPNNNRLKLVSTLGKISVDELLYGPETELKEKISTHVDNIMNTEIKEFNTEKYKLLYDPYFKKETIDALIKNYSYAFLNDIGIKQQTKINLDDYLDKYVSTQRYTPHSNKNSIYFTYDKVKNDTRLLDDYFRADDIKPNLSFLEEDMLKPGLSYDLYKKLRIILENAYQEIDKLDS